MRKNSVVSRFDLLVCYDVNTTDPDGAKRLRKIAKVCVAYGQRVQYSVFECSLTDALLEKFQSRLLDIMDHDKDSLRFYRLIGSREIVVRVYGRDGFVDFTKPLIL